MLLGSADGQFETVGIFSGTRTRMPRAPLVRPGEDLALISPEVAEQPFTVDRAITFWRHCERFVTSVTPAIDAIARELASRGQLDGDEVVRLAVAAMTGRSAAWIPPWVTEE